MSGPCFSEHPLSKSLWYFAVSGGSPFRSASQKARALFTPFCYALPITMPASSGRRTERARKAAGSLCLLEDKSSCAGRGSFLSFRGQALAEPRQCSPGLGVSKSGRKIFKNANFQTLSELIRDPFPAL